MINRYQTAEMKTLFDEGERFKFLLDVEIAVAEGQANYGLIPKKAAVDIKQKSKINVARILEIEKTTKHDIIAFVSQVAESVGINGKYIHFGMTSSDVLDTALSLQINKAFEIILDEVKKLKKTLVKTAEKHEKTICPGRTHGIFAEITTFGFKMYGYVSELSRCEERLIKAQKQFAICKLSGAVGTSSTIPLEIEAFVAQKLKLNIEPFATQVVPRDRHAEVFMSLAFLASFLERLAVEFRHLQRSEVSEVIEGFTEGQKGSSAMPHKKNPISAENITGLARLVKGYAWTAMENIPLWHERDISHSSNERVIFQDSFTASHYILRRMESLIAGLHIDQKRMKENSQMLGGVLFSSHLLIYLVENHQMSREEAYKIIQQAAHGLKKDEHLSEKLLKKHPKYFNKKSLEILFSGQSHIKAIDNRIKKFKKEIL